MTDLFDDDPEGNLEAWTERIRSEAEDALLGEMMLIIGRENAAFDDLSTWLTAGAAAVAALFIANADTLKAVITTAGFLLCGAALLLSCAFGVLSRLQATRVKIGLASLKSIQQASANVMAAHRDKQKDVAETAREYRLSPKDSSPRMDRVLQAYVDAFPPHARFLLKRAMAKNAEHKLPGQRAVMRIAVWQATFGLLQVLLLGIFLIIGFIGAVVS